MLEEKKPKIFRFTHHDRCKHMSWCLRNGIKIYIKPCGWNVGNIVIHEDGKAPLVGQHVYSLNEKKLKRGEESWSTIIFKLYTTKYLENYEGKQE